MRIDKSELAKKSAKVKTAMPGKNSLTGNQGILIKGNKAIANNFEIGIVATLSEATEQPFILSPGAIDMIDSLPNDVIEITPKSGGKISINTGSIKNTFLGENPYSYSEPEAVDDIGQSLKIDSKALSKIVSSVSYAASTNETRPIYTGILFDAKEGELNVVAVDGYRAAWSKSSFEGEFKFIAPKTTLDKVLKLDIEGDIEISLGERNAIFVSEEYTAYTRLLSGDFIDYQKTFPKHEQQVEANRKALLENIGRILICVDNKTKTPAVMSIDKDKLTLSIKSSMADYSEEVDVEGALDELLQIGFNSHYLRDALKSSSSEIVILSFGTEVEPMVISGGELRSMVLPVRLRV